MIGQEKIKMYKPVTMQSKGNRGIALKTTLINDSSKLN